jgi:hypothetical protein
MSRGAGIIQRRLRAVYETTPTLRTVEQLAEIVFPGEVIERTHLVSVRRALKKLPGLNLHFFRMGKRRSRGWRYVVGRE